MRAVNSIALVLLWTAVPAQAGAASTATYQGLEPDTFMKRWLVLSPIRVSTDTQPEEAAQKAAFAHDFLQTAGGETSVQPAAEQTLQIDAKEYRWRPVSAESDAIDLSNGEASQDYAIAYAWAEIELERATTWLFGMGSDDALKVWLNGKLVHENWINRSARTDDDLVELPFQKGKNRLLLKIQNAGGSWEFMCRPLGRAALVKKFVTAAGLGDLEQMKKLLDRGVKVDGADRRGLTAWQGAKIHGRKEAAEFLRARGASMRLPQRPPRVVDKAFQEIVADTGAGVAVLVAQNGKILFEKGYGLANLEHHVAVTPATKFRIGSITKQFVAAAILKLHEQGKINFDDKLSKFMPDFPRGEQVTIHHLLTHTSGIHSYTGKPDFFETAPLFIKPEALIQSFKNDPYDFDPGTRWSYNNSGYFLLGVIIEKASGKSYEEFLRTSFFAPLGMTNTGVHHATDVIANEAHGYAFAGGKLKKALNWDMSRAGGAGSLYSTVGDLYRWNEGVFNGKVLAPASLKAAFTPVKTKENADEKLQEGYGYGWGIGKMRGLTQISHSGGLHGFTTCLLRVLEEKLTVTVLANASPAPPGLDPGVLANEIVQLFLADKLEWQPTLVVNRTVSPQVYDAYVGRYDYGTVMTISREGNRLFAQLAGQNKHEIFPKSETEFFWEVADAQVTFVKDEKGVVTKAIHRQRGQTLQAARLPDRTVAQVDPAALNAYVGKYDYGGGQAILTVTRDGNRLFAQLTGQPRFEIFSKSDTEFFWKTVEAQITFVKDEQGKVIKGIHQQGGQKFDAPKIE